MMSLLTLPNEILDIISSYLEINDILHLQQCNWECYTIFKDIFDQFSKNLPWKIIVDFSRNQHHHILLHKAWIQIGWISSNLNFCSIQRSYKHYMLIRQGYGKVLIECLRKYGSHPYIRFKKGYLPLIVKIGGNEESNDGYCSIPATIKIGSIHSYKSKSSCVNGSLIKIYNDIWFSETTPEWFHQSCHYLYRNP